MPLHRQRIETFTKPEVPQQDYGTSHRESHPVSLVASPAFVALPDRKIFHWQTPSDSCKFSQSFLSSSTLIPALLPKIAKTLLFALEGAVFSTRS
jgi:hypothetical protein